MDLDFSQELTEDIDSEFLKYLAEFRLFRLDLSGSHHASNFANRFEITHEALQHLRKCSSLRNLVIRYKHFTRSAFVELLKFEQLEVCAITKHVCMFASHVGRRR